jgi:type II secretory pathway pseudopilin PulG
MMLRSQGCRAMTVVEILITTTLIGVLGLVVYVLLNIGTILGAKNSAVNVAHQQARTAMLQMTQDLHSSVSPLTLVDDTGTPLPNLPDADGDLVVQNNGPAEGISFQLWDSGPYRIVNDGYVGDTGVLIYASKKPSAGQRLIVPTHEIEEDITNVSGGSSYYWLTLAHPLTVAIENTGTNHITGFITNRCSYIVKNGSLEWTGPVAKKAFSTAVMGNNITQSKPFTTPTTDSGSSNIRLVAAIDLSTTDVKYSNRGFKSANILLNGKVPTRAKLTAKQ